MNEQPRSTTQRTCEACLLATTMKDCNTCQFYLPYYRATSEDVFRMWQRLWGDLTPEQVRTITSWEAK